MRYTLALAAILMLGTPAVSFAQDADTGGEIDSEGSGAIPALPLHVKNMNGISYLSGGVSDESLSELKTYDKDFNVQILLAGAKGGYISGTMVRILDSKGEELLPTVENVGPYFYVSLPIANKYTVEVTTQQGEVKKANFTVPKTGAVKPILRFTE